MRNPLYSSSTRPTEPEAPHPFSFIILCAGGRTRFSGSLLLRASSSSASSSFNDIRGLTLSQIFVSRSFSASGHRSRAGKLHLLLEVLEVLMHYIPVLAQTTSDRFLVFGPERVDGGCRYCQGFQLRLCLCFCSS